MFLGWGKEKNVISNQWILKEGMGIHEKKEHIKFLKMIGMSMCWRQSAVQLILEFPLGEPFVLLWIENYQNEIMTE